MPEYHNPNLGKILAFIGLLVALASLFIPGVPSQAEAVAIVLVALGVVVL